jgi:hypothetical protein
MQLNIGDSIEWKSAAGTLHGKILKIELNDNAAGETVPWLFVETESNLGREYSIKLCASHQNLVMMQVVKLG